ncbi:MAG: hypothetical protein M3N07_02280 [Pseudomonadota bacterium]|nr:hypothetical protein [Pseudomonadota bacterium]
MTDLGSSERKYAQAMQRVLTDQDVQRELERDPVATLERLGFDLSPEARAQVEAQGAATAEIGVAAIPAVLVRVATGATRPVVSVVVQSATVAADRRPVKELAPKRTSGGRRRTAPKRPKS